MKNEFIDEISVGVAQIIALFIKALIIKGYYKKSIL